MLELERLYQLTVIAREGTLSAAAHKLHLSQPALSRSMQKLEQDLNVTLFERQKNRVFLNSTGELLVDYSCNLLEDIDKMVAHVQEHNRRLSVISIGGCAPAPLVRLYADVSVSYPDQIIESKMTPDSDTLCRGLENGTYQLIILPFPPASDKVCGFMCCQEHLFLALTPDHPLADRTDGIYLKEINGITMLLYNEIGSWEALCRREMPEAQFLVQSDRNVLAQLARSTSLPVFVTDLTFDAFPDGKVLIPILDEEANPEFWCHYLPQNREKLSRVLRE